MTPDEARVILGDLIADDRLTLDSRAGIGLRVDWWPGRGGIYIESIDISVETLEAIVVWVKANAPEAGR